jgi:hypothetical protein
MKILTFFLLLTSICTLYSCDGTGGPEGSPEETMKNFIEKVKANDYEGAKAFTNNNTDASLDFMKIQIQILKEAGKADLVPTLFGGIDMTEAIVTCTTTDKTATCKCCEEITGNCKDISVVQEGGKWLINMPKESTVEQ